MTLYGRLFRDNEYYILPRKINYPVSFAMLAFAKPIKDWLRRDFFGALAQKGSRAE